MSTDGDETKQRYHYELSLSITHPSMDPGEITAVLGLEPQYGWLVGTPRVAPNGATLPGGGVRRETYWCYAEEIENRRHFLAGVAELLQDLEPHKDFLLRVSDTGGRISMAVALPGSINIGDEIDPHTLMRFAALRIHLGIEVFPGMRLP